MRLIDAEVFAEISKNRVPEIIEDTWDEGYIDCLKVVDETPTVNAIPIEWIKEWCNKQNSKSLEERLLKRYGVITMFEDWEKENEID